MHVSLCIDVLGFDYINKFCMLYIVIFNFGLSENCTKLEKKSLWFGRLPSKCTNQILCASQKVRALKFKEVCKRAVNSFPLINNLIGSFRSENFNGETVEKSGVADWVFGVFYVLLSSFLEASEKMSKNIPASEFAFSLGLSPSAGVY